jgi:hypothetical protein
VLQLPALRELDVQCRARCGHDGSLLQVGAAAAAALRALTSLAVLTDAGSQQQIFERMTALRRLDLSGTDMQQHGLLPAVTRLSRLQRLALRLCSLAALPAALAGMQELEEVDVAFNQLTQLPPLPPSTRRLDLSFNRLSGAQSLAGVSSLGLLSSLRLDANHALAGLPDELAALAHLAELSIGHLRLAQLPLGVLAQLPSLAVVEAAGNQMAALPGELRQLLPGLRCLDVRANRGLHELPADPAAVLGGLRRLDLRGTPVAAEGVPKGLQGVAGLEVLA